MYDTPGRQLACLHELLLYDTPGRQLACLHELPAVSRQTGEAVFPVMIKIREGEEEDERADQTSEKGIEV